jgi:hypothetical protein
MTFDDTLQRAFETLTERLRDELARQLQDVAREVAASSRTEREAAVGAAETRVRVEAERDAERVRTAAINEAEARVRLEAGRDAERVRQAAVEEAEVRVRLEVERDAERVRKAAVDDAETRVRLEVDREVERARQEAERDAEARLQVEIAAAEARSRDQAEAKSRQELALLEQRATERIDRAVAAAREDARSADLSASERLADAVRAMDRERSLGEILDTLASCAGREAARVGLFLVRAGELRGWRFVGFGPAFDAASTIVVPPEESGILAEAIRTGDAISSDTSGPLPAPAFAGLPGGREGLAVPVAMGGDVIAVLYADQGTGGEGVQRPSTLTWPDAIEIMARHAARCLEAATAIGAMHVLTERPAAASRPSLPATASAAPAAQNDEVDAARRYARLLVSEIKLYHEADIVAGCRDRDLGTRLGVEIARARELYEQRVPSGLRDHVDHFHDELVRTLANGDASLLGQTT